MLTSQDLSQIRTLLKEEIGSEVRKVVQEELKPVNKKLNKIEKDLLTTISFFDSELLGHHPSVIASI
jgi:protein subunit release factor A